MHFACFLQFATALLISYISWGIHKPYDLSVMREYGRLSAHRPPPPPPPQVFFSTSADWADDYHLSSLANRTKTTPLLPVFDYTGTTENSDGSLPGHLMTVAAEVLIAILYVLVAVGPSAATAWALLGLRSRDVLNLEKGIVLSLALLWEQSAIAENDKFLIAQMRSSLAKAATRLAIQGAQLTRAGLIKDELVAGLSAIQTGLRTEQRASRNQIQQANQERDTLRTEHEALLRTVEDLRARETAREATRRLVEATAKRQESAANGRIHELEAEQASGLEKTEKLETALREARELISSLQSTIQSNSQELHAHRGRARAQQQMGYSAPFAPGPPRPQYPPQGQFGFPPNRTSGFMGNTPPPPPGYGRGAGPM